MSEEEPLLPSHHPTDDAHSYLQSHIPNARNKYQHAKLRTAEFLESAPLHYTVITLVLIDTACVLADLTYTFLSEDCTPIEGPNAPLWLNILAQISLAITTLFLGEIPVTIWAMGIQQYNPFGPVPHAALHFFDAVVILTTFVLEVVLRGRERELASLLIVLRLWRLVKLVEGIAVSAGELDEEQAKELAETKEELIKTLSLFQSTRDENQLLRERITWLEQSVQEQTAREEL